MKPAVAIIHHGFVPKYRVKFYEQLNEKGGARYVIFHGDPPPGTGHESAALEPFPFPNQRVRNRAWQVGRWLVIYQPLIRQIVVGRYSCVVISHEVKFVSNMLLFALRKLIRQPVMFWGQGFHVRSGLAEQPATGLIGNLVGGAKGALSRTADGYLVYTKGGAEKLRHAGVPASKVWPVQNTLDIEEACRAHLKYAQTDAGGLKVQLGLPGEHQVMLFIGRLIDGKRINQLIDLERALNEQSRVPTTIIIIGDGPLRTQLEKNAAGRAAVHFRGAIYSEDEIARYMRVATAVVIPGPVGLVVNQAFAHGVPVITRAAPDHGPEVEYIRHGDNGLVVEGSPETFAAECRRVLGDTSLRTRLSAGALSTRRELSLEYMVEAFDRAVLTTMARRRAPMPR